ncbi:hypothetical protein LCGC14_1990870 [marine sediment metagenome]|uniref:Uncharacterized protein n=1 Tax=marine sediment metagenome TaxID=412755 RepID=A0A0F9FU80_9ZZZZ
MDITIVRDKRKLNEAYDILVEKVDAISTQFQLSYFELYGILEAVKCDLFNQVHDEDEDATD